MRIRYLVVGSGWRAEFYLCIARQLPENFQVTGVVTGNKARAERYAAWGFPCFSSLGDALHVARPLFAVVSVAAGAAPGVALSLLKQGVPVLEETPAAPDLPSLLEMAAVIPKGAKFAVAEQYHLRPDHMAKMAVVRSGRIGRPVQALVSLTNTYHALSLIRRYLGVSGARAEVRAQRFTVPGMPGRGREGLPAEEKPAAYLQTIASFDFGEAQGLYNFEEMQHRSFIRSPRVQIKGDRGEIDNGNIKYLLDYRTPMETVLVRRTLGEEDQVEGMGLEGYLACGEWVYRNPFPGSRLNDDELAVAECLSRMAAYCEGGPCLYGFAEAAQDVYLSALMQQAAETGRAVGAAPQPWTADLQGT